MKWIKTSEELPENERELLVMTNMKTLVFAYKFLDDHIFIRSDDYGIHWNFSDITHWMYCEDLIEEALK